MDLSTFLISSGNIILSPKDWWALNRRKRITSLYSLEVKYGGPHARDRFVGQCFREMRSKKKTVCGDRMGFKDFFVPILSKGRILGCLQAGAFAKKEITFETLSHCWKQLSGRAVSPDPDGISGIHPDPSGNPGPGRPPFFRLPGVLGAFCPAPFIRRGRRRIHRPKAPGTADRGFCQGIAPQLLAGMGPGKAHDF